MSLVRISSLLVLTLGGATLTNAHYGFEQSYVRLADETDANTWPDDLPQMAAIMVESDWNSTIPPTSTLRGSAIKLTASSQIIQPIMVTNFYKRNGEGKISIDALRRQIQVLNGAFSNARISFRLAGVRFVQNDDYQHACTLIDRIMKYKPQYSMDPARYLNVYFCNVESRLGLSWYIWNNWFAWPGNEHSNALGPMIHWELLPGNSFRGGLWNQGKILVHEVGHSFGLLHLYDGGCNRPESETDGISDTPRQDGNPLLPCGAVRNKDSCPNQPGQDDLSNYMGATGDSCRDHFTPGQVSRMRQTINNYMPTLMKQQLPNCVAAVDSSDDSPDFAPCLDGSLEDAGNGRKKCKTDPTNNQVWAYACCPDSLDFDVFTCKGSPRF